MRNPNVSINVPGPTVPISEFQEFPVVSGQGKSAVILSYGELERDGEEIQRLDEGEWFATITANEQGNGMEVVTGWVEYQGVGATCIHLNRGWDNAYWVAPETKVMAIPNPFPDKGMSTGDE